MTFENYIQNYQNYLNEEKNKLTQKAQQLKSELREDEYKFAQVELNIIDIFSQMFMISSKKAAPAQNWQIVLKETYLSFFEKIPHAWHENLLKCIQHGLEEEAFVETLKISKADHLKEAFIVMINESV